MQSVISRVYPASSTSAVPERPVGTRRLAHHGRWSTARAKVTARQAAHATFGDVPVNFGRVVCRRAAPLADGYERALCAWRHGRVDDAKNAFEEHLTRAPRDVKAWISYAQMVKRPRGDEEVVSRLQPGMVAATDVSVSRQSVFRARRVLHRAIASCEDNSSKAVVLQTLGLLELTHGNETYGSALLEFCVGQSGGALAPVLRWHRVRATRRSVVAASGGGGGGVGRLRRARENVQSRVLLPSAFMREEPTPEA